MSEELKGTRYEQMHLWDAISKEPFSISADNLGEIIFNSHIEHLLGLISDDLDNLDVVYSSTVNDIQYKGSEDADYPTSLKAQLSNSFEVETQLLVLGL